MPTKKLQILTNLKDGLVQYDAAQTLTEEQKAQARENIDAAEYLDKDDALELAVELELIEPTTDESGNVFTDENGALYSL